MVRCHEGSGKTGHTDETEFAPEPVTVEFTEQWRHALSSPG